MYQSLKNADSGETLNTIEVKDLEAFTNPIYHPDGKEVIVTGLNEGQPDLYAINLKKATATQLTNDIYSENMASFSSDGSRLIFSYDKRSVLNGRNHGKYTYDLAEMDYATREIKIYDIFQGADNLNPIF